MKASATWPSRWPISTRPTPRCKAQGVNFTGQPYLNQGNRLVFFTDCDGNFVHLIQREKPLP